MKATTIELFGVPSDQWIRDEAGRYLKESRAFHLEIGGTLAFPPASYAEYLQGAHWTQYRRRRIRKARAQCEHCGIDRNQCRKRYECDLNVHHLNYDSLGEESDADTLVVCLRCHVREECELLGHGAFIDVDEKRVRCVCGEALCKWV
jgi:hypothetical protein